MCMAAGIVNFGIQGSLFIFLLYALLAAETDPLSYTIKVLVGLSAPCGTYQHIARIPLSIIHHSHAVCPLTIILHHRAAIVR